MCVRVVIYITQELNVDQNKTKTKQNKKDLVLGLCSSFQDSILFLYLRNSSVACIFS